MKNNISEERIKEILIEEVQKIIDEGFMQDLASKASGAFKGLAMAAAMSAAGAAHATPGTLQSKETPFSSSTKRSADGNKVAQSLANALNKAGIKDKYGLDLSVDSFELTKLGQVTASLYNNFARADQTIDDYENVTLEILKVGFEPHGDTGKARTVPSKHAVFSYVHKLLEKKLKDGKARKKKKKPKTTFTKYETRNNSVLIYQGALGVYLDVSQGKDVDSSMKNLVKNLKIAIKDGDITRKDAFNILKSLKKAPGEGIKDIEKILKLEK